MREKCRKTNKKHNTSSDSSRHSYSGSKSSGVFRKARGAFGADKIHEACRRDSSALLKEGIVMMASFLTSLGWSPETSNELPACVTQYYTTVLKPHLGERLHPRSAHEMETLGEALDLLIKGKLVEGMSILMQRFKSLETNATDGHWDRAKHLELVRRDRISCVSPREADLARSNAVMDRKLATNPY